ncbi:unnamed protein product [Ectocarpus sp. 6 AP-2014]
MKLSHVRLLAIGCSARAWHRSAPLPNSAAFSCGGGIRFSWRGNRYSTSMSRGRRIPTAMGTGFDTGLQGSQQDEVQNRGGEGKLKIIYDEVFLKHRPPPGHPHPECPARVSTARSELDRLEGIEWATPSSLRSEKERERTLAAIERVHNPEYLEEVLRVCAKGGGAADFDTYICPDTFEVCIAASSAWIDAVESAAGGSPAFALARPPGHHATAGVGMGFCLVCFAAVAAFHALDALGCGRVAILDFDVHHGNGVAALVKGDARIRYCSIHQGGIFPGSGGAEDSGPLGNLKHLPFFGVDETWETYEPRFEEAVKWLEEFKPDLVLVSAGYDALEADELATASLQPKDYGRMGKRLKEVFGSKVAFGLEGGYNLQVTPVAIRATIEPFLCAGA